MTEIVHIGSPKTGLTACGRDLAGERWLRMKMFRKLTPRPPAWGGMRDAGLRPCVACKKERERIEAAALID